jgi:hypothetical protein
MLLYLNLTGEPGMNCDMWYPKVEELLAAHVVTGVDIPAKPQPPALAAQGPGLNP